MYGDGSIKVTTIGTKERRIFTKRDHVEPVLVPDDLPSMCDPAGYVDPNRRIDEMIRSGIRLDEWNKAVYDYENPDVDDDGETVDFDRYADDLELLRLGKISENKLDKYRMEVYKRYKEYLTQSSALNGKGYQLLDNERSETESSEAPDAPGGRVDGSK